MSEPSPIIGSAFADNWYRLEHKVVELNRQVDELTRQKAEAIQAEKAASRRADEATRRADAAEAEAASAKARLGAMTRVAEQLVTDVNVLSHEAPRAVDLVAQLSLCAGRIAAVTDAEQARAALAAAKAVR